MTRVLHVVWDGHSGGTQRYVDGVLRAPEWKGNHEHAVAMFTRTGDQIGDGSPYRVDALGIQSGFALRAARRLGTIVAEFDPAVLHVHCDTPAFLLQAGRLARGGRRLIYTEHGDCFARDRRRLAQTWCWRWSARHWSVILANSEFARRTLVDEVPAFASRSRVLGNPLLDPVPARPDREPGPIRIGGLGRLEPIKGFDVLLEAAAQLKDEHEFEITVFGKGGEEEALRDQASRLGLGDRVSLPGYTPNPMLALGGFDIVAIPSRKEAFGLVAIEAQAMGSPVVVADVGGLSERVDPGRTGLRVSPDAPGELAEALRRLIEDPEARERMGRAARDEALRSYDLKSHIHVLQDIYAGTSISPSLRNR